jgi:hypothetical protein
VLEVGMSGLSGGESFSSGTVQVFLDVLIGDSEDKYWLLCRKFVQDTINVVRS